jgi:hypothetical protein
MDMKHLQSQKPRVLHGNYGDAEKAPCPARVIKPLAKRGRGCQGAPVVEKQPTEPEESKAVKTAFGVVDRRALEDLRGRYDTFALLDAVDAIDRVRYCADSLREGVMALHGMAMNLINDNFNAGTPGEEPISELAFRLTGDILECIAHLEKAYAAIRPLEALGADPDDEEDAEALGA